MDDKDRVGALAEAYMTAAALRAGCNVARPVVDVHGIDLFVCAPVPPATAAVQVKGFSDGGFRVWRAYDVPWLWLAYVLFNPGDQRAEPQLYLLRGPDAVALVDRHRARGPRRASDWWPDTPDYRFRSLRYGYTVEVFDDLQQHRIDAGDELVVTLFGEANMPC